jgi:hypothetical protein
MIDPIFFFAILVFRSSNRVQMFPTQQAAQLPQRPLPVMYAVCNPAQEAAVRPAKSKHPPHLSTTIPHHPPPIW